MHNSAITVLYIIGLHQVLVSHYCLKYKFLIITKRHPLRALLSLEKLVLRANPNAAKTPIEHRHRDSLEAPKIKMLLQK